MTFEEILALVEKKVAKAKVSGKEELSARIKVTGDHPGVFDVIIKDSKMAIDNVPKGQCDNMVVIKSEDLERLLKKDLNPVVAVTRGKIKVKGDVKKMLKIAKMLM